MGDAWSREAENHRWEELNEAIGVSGEKIKQLLDELREQHWQRCKAYNEEIACIQARCPHQMEGSYGIGPNRERCKYCDLIVDC